jgi:hypothetical protein
MLAAHDRLPPRSSRAQLAVVESLPHEVLPLLAEHVQPLSVHAAENKRSSYGLVDKVPGLDSVAQVVGAPLVATSGALVFASQTRAIDRVDPGLQACSAWAQEPRPRPQCTSCERRPGRC